MEWSLFFAQYDRLRFLTEPWRTALKDTNHYPEVIQEVYGAINFTRIYFGQEFCQRAIPTVKELAEVVKTAKKHKRDLTLVTPFVTEDGLAKVEQLLKEFAQMQPQGEVVVNDWGVLYLVAARYPTLKPVLGRLLNKTWRDPRMTSFLGDISQEHLNLFQTCSLAGSHMKDLLNKMKVKRIELDNLLQGLSDSLPRWGYRVSLYIPYGCITTGRICLFNSWGLKHGEKFRATHNSCRRLCRAYWLKLSDRSSLLDKNVEIIQKGNTIFYLQSEGLLKRGLLQAADLGIDRIIVQPEPV